MPDVNFEVRWLPFFLNPCMPLAPINKREWYEKKFGAERVAMMMPRMSAVGKELGIDFCTDGSIAGTLDSHRLIAWATEKGKGNEAIEEVFKRYFEQGLSPACHDTLADAAEAAGLDKSEAEAVLASDRYKEQVLQEATDVRSSYKVTGVPFFVVKAEPDGKPVGFSGAQDPDVIVQAFKQALGTRSSA